MITLQSCIRFFCTTKWISYMCAYIPPPAHPLLHPIPRVITGPQAELSAILPLPTSSLFTHGSVYKALPGWLSGWRICLQCRRHREWGPIPESGRSPWRRAWSIPWTEEAGGLQSIASQRVAHDWRTEHTQPSVYVSVLTSQFILLSSPTVHMSILCVWVAVF